MYDQLINKNVISEDSFYRSNLEQIFDFLMLLDLRICLALSTQQSSTEFNAFKGLFIKHEEMASLFSHGIENQKSSKEMEHLRKQIKEKDHEVERKSRISKERGIFLSFGHLCDTFDLSWFEKQVVLMCLACELDNKYEKVYGFLQDDLTLKYPTLDLVLNMLCKSEEDNFKRRIYWRRQGLLQRYLLIDTVERGSVESSKKELRLRSEIVDFIIYGDSALSEFDMYIEVYRKNDIIEPLSIGIQVHEKLKQYLSDIQNQSMKERKLLCVNIAGPEGAGKTLHVKHLCKYFHRNLLLVNMDLIVNEEKAEVLAMHIVCLKKLMCAMLAVKFTDVAEKTNTYKEKEVMMFLKCVLNLLQSEEMWQEPLFFISRGNVDFEWLSNKGNIVDIEFQVPDLKERKLLWETLSAKYRHSGSINWGEIAAKFRFTPGQIEKALALAKTNAAWKMSEDGICEEDLYSACCSNGKKLLLKKASKLEARYGWEDIILPRDAGEQLKNACNQMKYRQTVMGDWGFGQKLAYGKSLSILFSGPPGTGKTMGAQVVAKELRLELYKVDISQLVSKYIGETEKNLAEVFSEAEKCNAILFFDEADALFGKRSEVKDSHDRYSNTETAYLLQRIEEYEGVCILATNYIKNIDGAFLRRFNFVIEFPFPDDKYRERIWHSIFPKETPLDDIDFQLIARKFEVSGGNIKNIALSAAFLAASEGKPVGMQHVIKAAQNEMAKMGKMLLMHDLQDFLSM